MKHVLLGCLLCILCFSIKAQTVTIEQIERAKKAASISRDSSLTVFENLEEFYPQMSDEEKALYGLFYTEAILAAGGNVVDDQYINFSIDYFTRTNKKSHLARSWIYKGRIYKFARDYPNAARSLLMAKDILDPKKDFSMLGNIYSDLAHLSSYQDEFDKSLEYINLAIKYFEKGTNKDNLAKMYVLKAWFFQSMVELDSAIVSSQKALKLTTDRVTMGDALNDIGYTYYRKGELDSADYYITKSLTYPSIYKNGAMRYLHQAEVFEAMKDYDSAKESLRNALNSDIDVYTENDCFKLLISISLMTGDIENLAGYIARQRIAGDSIRKIELQPKITTLEQLHKTTKESEKVREQNIMLLLLITVVLIVVAPIFILLYRQKKQEREKADIYKVELEKKHETLLQELNNDFEKTREKYAEKRKKSDFAQRQEIEREIYNEVLYFDDEPKFIDKMNAVLNHLPNKLKENYPNISAKETVWSCLFLLDVPTQDIAMLLDYTQSSLYKFKQRLAKKLNLSGSKELEQMLREKADI